MLNTVIISIGIAVKESAKIGSKVAKGVDDLDFFIGDDAQDKPNYAIKVCFEHIYTLNVLLLFITFFIC